jgi:RecB family exonuclease
LSLPTPSGPQQAFGSTIHGVLEEAGKALMESRKPALDELVASFERRWVQAGLSDPDRKERLRIRGRETLERFLNMQAERPGRPVALEKMFAINLLPERGGESPVLTGRIDRIDTTANGFEIIDYKTGKQTGLKSDLQLAIYSLACRSLFGEYAGRVIYMFLGEGTIHEASYDADALEAVKSEILGVIEEITKSDFMATPGHVCSSCPFAKICPARLNA